MELTQVFMLAWFLLTAYSVVANDSIQTLWTFIASNKKIKWQYLWAFITSILIITIWYSWYKYSWDISYGRLEKIPFQTVEWYHVLAPLTLVVLTRFWIPVSTSLIIFSTFASSLVFTSILVKSFLWYSLAFITAMIIWFLAIKFLKDKFDKELTSFWKKKWRIFQRWATAFLWWSWLSHDIANISVFLPRDLWVNHMIWISLVFSVALFYIFSKRWWKIQEIVLSKTNLSYIKTATFIDLTYAFLLVFFKEYNSLPMSTTWVFLWLLAWREFSIYLTNKEVKFKDFFPIVWKDIFKVMFWLAISIAIVVFVQSFSS